MAKHRVILHVDMDAFFAAVEELDNPDLKGKPVIIGSDPKEGRGRGVVSTSNYEARKYKVFSAMPISKAWQLCPHGVFIRPNGKRYHEMSKRVMAILKTFSPLVEQVSVDEAFLDCTGCERLFGNVRELGLMIKQKVVDETGLTCSVGIAVNKSIAKIASDYQKPDGLTIVPPGKERVFLADLPIKKLWGVGKKSQEALHRYNIYLVKDVMDKSKDYFEKLFGKHGEHLWNMANGIDDRPVIASDFDDTLRKSISEERTFEYDVDDRDVCEKVILKLVDDIAIAMRKEKILGKTITVKIRLEGFKTFTRGLTIDSHIHDSATIQQYALKLFREFDNNNKKYRLIGVQVSNIIEEKDYRPGLFDGIDDKHKKIDEALDEIKNKFGKKSIDRAIFLEKE